MHKDVPQNFHLAITFSLQNCILVPTYPHFRSSIDAAGSGARSECKLKGHTDVKPRFSSSFFD